MSFKGVLNLGNSWEFCLKNSPLIQHKQTIISPSLLGAVY